MVGEAEDFDLFLRALAGDRRQRCGSRACWRSAARQTGRRIQGYPILGSIDDAASVLERLRGDGRLPGTLVMATPDLCGPVPGACWWSRPTASACASAARRGRPHWTRPLGWTARGQLELRPMAIEDLLNRPQVPLDRDGMARLIQGRRVIVTGAGGTIGSELARQVAAFGPERLVLLDNGEYALWQIDLELAETPPARRRVSR